ncbi:Nramp family divalent metal transporter [Fidelibacter multiformis]|jgi:Mn2+/Fe2+ NRAMP family transporter|uniref:Nramp family divalent metal transporter n=1 Tax=Fidelibacter multiformis TaxID=3377529 RepID=UPI0037DCF38C
MMKSEKIKGLLSTLGPGILFAGAAIGGSHLVQSTRAGANYGFTLMGLVVLTLVLKYPFFQYSHRYAARTGKSLVEGYREQGQWVLGLFFFFAVIVGIINVAAVTLVTGGLASYLTHWTCHPALSSAAVLAIVLLMIVIGKYPFIDKIMKVMVFVLGIFTILAVLMALKASGIHPEPVSLTGLTELSGIAFLLALMGWMPAPIDVSVWPSLWVKERRIQTGHTPSLEESLTDFHIGYITTGILALAFIALGALVMYGTGEHFSNSSVVFSRQLIELYTQTLGTWSRWIIALIAFLTMFSTTLTTLDGYSRTLSESVRELFYRNRKYPFSVFWMIVALLVLSGLLIIGVFLSGIKTLVDVATILAFLTAPVFALLNFRLVSARHFPKEDRPGIFMQVLSWCGILFLTGFSLIYLWKMMSS